MSFNDPHGLRNDGNFNDDKIQLHEDIKEIEQEVKKKCPDVKLESLILSVSKYKDIKDAFEDGRRSKEDFEKNHVLFMEDKTVMEKVFHTLL